MKKSNIKVKCDNCGKMICLIPYQIKNFKHHFCDLKCKGEFFSGNKNSFFNKSHSSQTKKILRDKALIRFELNGHPLKNKRIKESSKIKMSEAKKGKYLSKNNPNWKGGISKREFEEAFGCTISQWDELTTKIR